MALVSSNAGDLLQRLPPIPRDLWGDWVLSLLNCEAGGNDGADVYQCQVYAEEIESITGRPLKQVLEEMETWVMRKMGRAFDPERHCPYTGANLWQFPFAFTLDARLMGYYRETDGWLLRVRLLTPAEVAWIEANPERFILESERFKAWIGSVDDIPF